MRRNSLVACLAAAAVQAGAFSQGWIEQPFPPELVFRTAAEDPLRGRIVMIGSDNGLQTWEWDGRSWTRRLPATSPPTPGEMAWDGANGRVLLFGGATNAGTMAWDGRDWVVLAPAQTPPPRHGHAMAWDAARGRVVLFGGTDSSGSSSGRMGDTWEWDGTTWMQRFPARSPSPRFEHAMAYDAARQRVVLFGGRGAFGLTVNETWEWDGTTWTQAMPARLPPVNEPSLAFDPTRRRVLLVDTLANLQTATWEWDGVDWTPLTPQTALAGRRSTIVHDSARGSILAVLDRGAGRQTDTWEWNGSDWRELAASSPGPVHDHVLGYDESRGIALLHGGLFASTGFATDATWLWTDARWERVHPTRTVTAYGHAMWYDTSRQRLAFFGEASPRPSSPTVFSGSTWEWDGTDWQKLSYDVGPAPRAGHAAAYDTARQRAVVFGGESFDPISGQMTSFADTWEWDGSTWRRMSPATSPPGGAGASMAYDPVRARAVLFTGAQTWEWDGTGWRRRAPATSPSRRLDHALVYDPGRQRVVLLGGQLGAPLAEMWEWDGTTWTQLTPPSVPPRSSPGLARDPQLRRLLLHGGRSTKPEADTWTFGGSVASTSLTGSGCGGPPGPPALDAFGAPRLGNPSYALDVLGAPPSAAGSLLLSALPASVPLPGGCTLRVDPAGPLVSVPVLVNAAGFASVALPIPPNPALSGGTVAAQAAVLDPTGPLFGLALSGGAVVDLGG